MKLAKKQQNLIINMSQALESKKIDITTLQIAKEKFSKVLLGLNNGDAYLDLKGTNIPTIKSKIDEVQALWNKEVTILNGLSSNDTNRDKALDGLNSIMIKMSQTVAEYNKSYSKFRQKSKLSSLVAHHMNNTKNKTFAFNIVQ